MPSPPPQLGLAFANLSLPALPAEPPAELAPEDLEAATAEPPEPVLAAEAEACCAALTRFYDAVRQACGAPAGQPPPPQLRLAWTPGQAPADFLDDNLATLQRALRGGYRPHPGRLYCYHCGSDECPHARPAAPGEVFAGYQNTGRPRWLEFLSYMLELEDTRLDQLFDEEHSLLGRVVGRQRLVAAQFLAYGRASLTCRVIGQVVAGYLAVGETACALSVLIVEDAGRNLHTQVIAPERLREALADARDRDASPFLRVHEALRATRQHVQALAVPWRGRLPRAERVSLREQLFATLRHLANSLERKGRQARRRTAHAELRQQQQRPVAKAHEDLAAALPEDFCLDRKTQCIVVLGRKGRLHVFNPEARHVTSLQLEGGQLERRFQRQRYVRLEPAALAEFRQKLQPSLPPAVPPAPDPG